MVNSNGGEEFYRPTIQFDFQDNIIKLVARTKYHALLAGFILEQTASDKAKPQAPNPSEDPAPAVVPATPEDTVVDNVIEGLADIKLQDDTVVEGEIARGKRAKNVRSARSDDGSKTASETSW